MTARIRKEGKARWVYACELCGVEGVVPDLFRAVEIQQRHEPSMQHTFNGITAAFARVFGTPPTQADLEREA